MFSKNEGTDHVSSLRKIGRKQSNSVCEIFFGFGFNNLLSENGTEGSNACLIMAQKTKTERQYNEADVFENAW